MAENSFKDLLKFDTKSPIFNVNHPSITQNFLSHNFSTFLTRLSRSTEKKFHQERGKHEKDKRKSLKGFRKQAFESAKIAERGKLFSGFLSQVSAAITK